MTGAFSLSTCAVLVSHQFIMMAVFSLSTCAVLVSHQFIMTGVFSLSTCAVLVSHQRIMTGVFSLSTCAVLVSHQCVMTGESFHSACAVLAEEAETQFGKDQVKVYQSTFTPMYYAVTETKYKCSMKLVCQLPTEKVCQLLVCFNW